MWSARALRVKVKDQYVHQNLFILLRDKMQSTIFLV